MNSMFTQHTTSNARLVPSVKLFTRCITAHCAHIMHYSQTNESNITLLIHLIILTGNTISISVFIDVLGAHGCHIFRRFVLRFLGFQHLKMIA